MENVFEIRESCVDLSVSQTDRESVLRHLAGLLAREGFVDNAYGDKIVEREASYPTGLPFPDMTIALPHGDPAYARRSAVAIGRCLKPVPFHSMEDPDDEVEVEMVALLAVKDPDAHVAVLNNLMQLFTQPEACAALRKADSPATVCSLFREALYQK